MQHELIRRFRAAVPGIRQWIEEYLGAHAEQAQSVITLGFERLPTCFPQELLERAKVVVVPQVQFPPVDRFGLPVLAPVQQIAFAGITFKDTFFLQEDQTSESIHFHELVHIVQWARLGIDNFLLAYGVGLIQCGYEQSPLERMAYTLQRSFDDGRPPQELVDVIEARTDDIWGRVAPVVRAGARVT